MMKNQLLNNAHSKQLVLAKNAKISLPINNGFNFVRFDDISHFYSDKNYSFVHFIDRSSFLVAMPLKELEKKLSQLRFYRNHHQILVNLDHIKRFEKGDGGVIILSNGVQLPISRNKKMEFLEMIKQGII